MKSKRKYQKGNRVLVRSYAGPDVIAVLTKRYIVSETKHKLGVDGWEAQITAPKEVEKLRKTGVPYQKGEKPMVWVFDWQIIKRC